MNDNDDAVLQMTARVNAHEFLLEVFIANWMSTMTEEQIGAFAADLIRVGRKGYGPISGDPAEIQRIQTVRAMSEQAIEQLAAKAERRALDIRQQRSPDPSRPR
ncbi:hypothetical protein [Reyranella sp.]|uniref:hypothetical protein n=1 Tax=Reyranella sp. TaxID=1929291 RepID=UPI003D12211C